MGVKHYSIGRRIDADTLDVYHDQKDRMMQMYKGTANQMHWKGGLGAGDGLFIFGNMSDALPYMGLSQTAITVRPQSATDYFINTSGGGQLRFGDYTVKGAEAFDGYISIKDDGGAARKLMTCA